MSTIFGYIFTVFHSLLIVAVVFGTSEENGDPSGSNESRSSNDSEEETPRRSVRKTLHANVEYTPRRSVREPLHSNVGYTPRRSIEISQASTTKSSVGDRSQQQSSIHLAPRRASTSYARPPTQNDSQSGPSRPGPSRYSQRQSSPSPRRRSRKQANPKRKDRAIKEIIKMQKSHNLLIPLAPFQRYVLKTFPILLLAKPIILNCFFSLSGWCAALCVKRC